MNEQRGSKLKHVLQSVPPGFLVDTAWMTQHAISRQSVSAYVKQGWLEHVMQGLYRRSLSGGENAKAIIGWKMSVLSAQWLMKYDFHVGGTSALTLRGHTHYLRLGGDFALYLYGSDTPSWLLKLQTDARVIHRSDGLFGTDRIGIENNELDLSECADGELIQSPWHWPVRMSSPERAILEAIDEVPKTESFHTIDVAFEGLVNLRPKQLMKLLTDCRSVKVKRLFFVYADKHAHAWRRHIDLTCIDMGSGDRELARGGRLHPKYRITIPEDLLPAQAPDGA